MVFVELPLFSKYLRLADEELRALQKELIADPLRGDLIRGSHGLRKLRLARAGQGKRGGGRVIYYFQAAKDLCYLIFAYPKSVQDDLTADQLKALVAAMKEELDDG